MKFPKFFYKKNYYIFFIIISFFILYLISSNYMKSRYDEKIFLTAFDAGRYFASNFFDGEVSGKKTAWHLFFTYTLFIRFLIYFNLVNYYAEIQYFIFYLSSFFFYKSLVKFNFSKFTSFFATLFIIINPFVIFWIQTINHAGLTISLLMFVMYFLSMYDENYKFKVLFFIFIFLFLKIDGKVFFTTFMILFYKFYLSIHESKNFNLLLLISFFLFYFLYLNHFAIGLELFSQSYLQSDISSNKYISPLINNDVIQTYYKCLLTIENSLQNHICAFLDNPIYSIKLYAARLFILLTWINSKLSLKYNFFAFGMMLFIYTGITLNLLNSKFTKFTFFLLSSYFVTILIVLPYILRGDQKQVFYGLVFIVPLAISGFEILLKKKNK